MSYSSYLGFDVAVQVGFTLWLPGNRSRLAYDRG